MRRSKRSILAAALAAGCLATLASGVEPGAGLLEVLKGMRNITAERKTAFEANYPGTACVDVFLAGSRTSVGFVCRTSNKAFVDDMGIVAYDGLAPSSRPDRRPVTGLVVATPMAQYPMMPMPVKKGNVATADVDCDIESGPVYRATATCHVAVTPPEQAVVTYTNFVLRYHRGDGRGVTREQVGQIWQQLDRLVGSPQ